MAELGPGRRRDHRSAAHAQDQDLLGLHARVARARWTKWCVERPHHNSTADDLDARIDLSEPTPTSIRVFDVNGDGLVDVVKTARARRWRSGTHSVDTPVELVGSGARTVDGTGHGRACRMDPVMRCLPHWSATPIRFSDTDIKLGDMNGDGLTDIVRMSRQGDVKFWPGRGDGSFWHGSAGLRRKAPSRPEHLCPDGREAVDYTGHRTTAGCGVDDVNGDGTWPISIQVRFQDLDIWYNRQRLVVRRAIAGSSHDTPA